MQRAILKAFGPSVFNEDGTKVERDKLGSIVFSDPSKRKILNGIVHPVVFRRIAGQIFRNFLEGQPFVVMDIPLLFETRTMLWFVSDVIVVNWYVNCNAIDILHYLSFFGYTKHAFYIHGVLWEILIIFRCFCGIELRKCILH